MTPEIFTRSAKRIGLIANVVKRELSQITELVLPAVLILKENDAVVLRSIDREANTADVYVAAHNELSIMPLSKLQELYSGMAIYCTSEPNFDDRIDKPEKNYEGHWFWKVILGARKKIVDEIRGVFIFGGGLP